MQRLNRVTLKQWMVMDGFMGDPQGFGKRQDPFSAVIAVLAGAAETATVISAVGEVGLAMGVVGAVTGNKTLLKVGGAMGLASGIGSIANSAFGAAEASAGSVASNALGDTGSDWASGAATDAATTSSVAAPSVETLNAANDAGTMPLDSVDKGLIDANGNTPTMGDGIGQPALSNAGDPTLNTGSTPSTGAPANAGTSATGQSVGTSVGQDASGNQIGASASGQQPFSDAGFASQNAIDPNYTNSGTATQASWLDKMMNYLGTDKGMDTGLKLGGMALSGIGNSYAANRKYQLDKTLVDMKAQQQANANDQVKIAGIINNARKA